MSSIRDVLKPKVLSCVKCGNEKLTDGIDVKYSPTYFYKNLLMSKEYLTWTCKRCEFSWETETLDKYEEE